MANRVRSSLRAPQNRWSEVRKPFRIKDRVSRILTKDYEAKIIFQTLSFDTRRKKAIEAQLHSSSPTNDSSVSKDAEIADLILHPQSSKCQTIEDKLQVTELSIAITEKNDSLGGLQTV